MANALQQQMADDIASLVRKQTFSGSGVWRQSGNATLRIQTQTDSIVEALQRIPSLETQEEEERESDRQHEELINAIYDERAVKIKEGGLTSSEKTAVLDRYDRERPKALALNTNTEFNVASLSP